LPTEPGRTDPRVWQQGSAGRDVYVAGRDLSVVNIGPEAPGGAPRVSSGYIEQVRRIAPEELVGRAPELAELERFCKSEPGSSYAFWRAGGWAGKSALLSWFVLHPPPGVDVVSFFVTARFAGQSDHVAFTEVLLEQLAALLGQDLPALLSPATREGHFLQMLREAARACESAGRRLVLVVDGLDEDTGVTSGHDAYSIAALLPRAPAHGLRVIVSARPDPPIPPDVRAGHPLRDAGIARILSRSGKAEMIRADAERGLLRILSGTGLEQDLLGLITAAGGGLTGRDAAEITGESEYEVRRVLHSVSGRSFASRERRWQPGTVYVLAHEDLQEAALEALGGKRLAAARERIRAWAAGYREASWPPGTPEYLLRGYFQMLAAEGDTPGVLGCALDRARHDRTRDLAGGDASALAEISAAQRMILSSSVPDLTAMARLARHRDELTARNAWIPVRLPAVWARLGHAARAEELARSGSDPEWQARALAGVAAALAAGGRYDPAEELAASVSDPAERARAFGQVAAALAAAGHYDRARELAAVITDPAQQAETLAQVAAALAAAGHYDRAEELAWSSAEPGHRAQALAQVVKALAGAGLHERAAELALSIPDGHLRERALIHVAASAAQAGHPDKAEALAFAIPDPFWRAQALTAIAAALAVTGEYDRGIAVAWSIPDPYWHALALAQLSGIFAAAGRIDLVTPTAQAAEASAGSVADRRQQAEALTQIAGALSAAGLHEQASATARGIPDDARRDEVTAGLSETAAGTGEVTTARPVVTSDPRQQAEALTAQAETLIGAGQLDAARQMAARAEALVRSITDRSRQAGELLCLAEALSAAGEHHRGAMVIRRAAAVTSPGPGASPRIAAPLLTRMARVLAAAGEHDEAERLARSAKDPPDQAEGLIEVAAALPAAQRHDRIRSIHALAVRHDVETWPRATITRLLSLMAISGLCDEAADIARRCGSHRMHAEYLEFVAEALATAGRHDRLEDLYRSARSGDRDRLRCAVAKMLIKGGMRQRGEAILMDVTDLEWKSEALATLATELAVDGAHDSAEAIARRIPNPDWRGSGIVRVAKELAAVGLYERAEALATSMKSGQFDEEPLTRAAESLASAGWYEQATAVARSIAHRGHRATALTRIITGLASAGDQDKAAHAADEAEKFIDEFADPRTRALKTIELAQALAGAGRQSRAIRLARQAEKLARSLPSTEHREDVLVRLAETLATAGQPEKALASARSITDPDLQSRAIAGIARSLGGSGPARRIIAAAWANARWTTPLAAAASVAPTTLAELADDTIQSAAHLRHRRLPARRWSGPQPANRRDGAPQLSRDSVRRWFRTGWADSRYHRLGASILPRQPLSPETDLPDADPGRRVEPQFVGGADVERGVELVEVAHDLIAAELAGRVRVDREQPDDLLVAGLLTPDARPGQEKALRARQPVDHRSGLALQRQQVGLPGDPEAAEVADVLPDRQRSVHVVAGCLLRGQGVVLPDESCGPGLERRSVLFGPPVSEPAVAVDLGALVVEAVADLVADDRADRPVIGRVVATGVEERVLQDRRGEHDLVHSGVVVGVDGLRRHVPLVAVDRLADLGQLTPELEGLGGVNVGDQVRRVNPQGGVVPPPNRVADLRRELPEFVQGPPARVRPHPVQCFDGLPVGVNEAGNQDVHSPLGRRREVPGDVDASYGLPHR
jgi:tetratricopeptide (TPR) repeat protein